MSDFQRKKITAETVAEKLRSLREKSSLSVEELSEQTGIRAIYIRALEEGDFDSLPSPVYVRGFITACARVLKADPRPLLRAYGREIGLRSAGNKKKSSRKEESVPLLRRVTLSRPWVAENVLWFVSALVVLATFGWYLYGVYFTFAAEPPLTIHSPANGVTLRDPTVKIIGDTDASAKVTINGREVVVGRDGSFVEELSLGFGVNTLIISAVNRFDKKTQRTLTVYVDKPPVPEAEEETVADKIDLTLKVAKAPVWLEVKVDDQTVLSETLPVGKELNFVGREIKISSGAGKRTLIRLGKDGEFQVLSDKPGPVREKVFALPNENDDFSEEINTEETN